MARGQGTQLASAYVVFGGDFQDYLQAQRKVIRETQRTASTMQRSYSNATSMIKRDFTRLGKSAKRSMTQIAGDIGRVSKALMEIPATAAKTYGTFRKTLADITKYVVFWQLDIRYIITQVRNALLGLGGAIGGAVGFLAQYEESFVRVRRVVDMTSQELDELARTIRDMSRELVTGANELAEITAVGGQLGIEGVDNLERFTETVAMLAETTRIAGETGAADLARIMTVMGESMDTIDDLASTIVHLGNTFAAFEDEMVTMAFRVSGAGSAIGLASDEVLALSTALTAVGVRAERGGTAISRIMIEMAGAAEEGGDMLRTFADVADTSMEDFARIIHEEPIIAIQEFIEGLARLDEEGENVFAVFDRLGIGQIRTRDALLRLVSATELLGDATTEARKAWEDGEYHAREFETRMDTMTAQARRLWDSVKDVAMTLGEQFEPSVRDATRVMADFVGEFAELDDHVYESIAGFLKLSAVLLGMLFAVLVTARFLLVMTTGIILLARALLFLGPLIFVLWAFSWAWEEIMSAMGKEDVDTIEGVTKALQGLANIAQDLGDAFVELELTQDVWESLQESWEDFLDLVADASNEEITAPVFGLRVGELTMDLQTDIIEAFSAAIQRASDYISRVKVLEDGIGFDFEGLDEDEQEFAKAFTGLLESIMDFIEATFLLFGRDMPLLFIEAFKKGWEAIDSDALKEGVKDLISAMGEAITDSMDEEEMTWRDKIEEGLWQIFGMYMTGQAIGGALPGMGGVLTMPLEIVLTVARGILLGGAFATGSKLFSALFGIGVGKIGKTLVIPFALADVTLRGLDWMSDDYWEYDPDYSWDGFMDGLHEAWEDMKNFWDWITDTLLKPSNWEINIPKFWTAEYWNNLKESLQDLYDSIKDLGEYIKEYKFPDWFPSISSPFGGAGGGGGAGSEPRPTDAQGILDQVLFKFLNPWAPAEGYSDGGIIPGFGGGDRVPALLERGEGVVPAHVVQGGMDSVVAWFRSMGVPGYAEGCLPVASALGGMGSDESGVLNALAQALSLTDTPDDELTGIQELLQGLMDQDLDNAADALAKVLDNVSDDMQGAAAGVIAGMAPIADLFDEDYGDVFRELSAYIDDLLTELRTPPDEEEAKEAAAMITPDLRGISAGIGEDLLPDSMIHQIVDLLEGPAVFWKNVVTSAYESIVEGAKSVGKGFVNAGEAIWNFITSEYHRAAITESVIAAMRDFRDNVWEATTAIYEGLGAALVDAEPRLRGAISAYSDIIEQGGTAMMGWIGVIVSLLTETESFETAMALISKVVDALVQALDPIVEAILPMLYVATAVMIPIFELLGVIIESLVMPIFKALFPVVRFVGIVFLFVAEAINTIWMGLLMTLRGVFRALDNIPFVDLGDQIDSLSGSIDEAKKRNEEYAEQREELKDLTWEAAMAKAKETEATEEATSAMQNVPDVFRAMLRLTEAGDDESLSNPFDVRIIDEDLDVQEMARSGSGEEIHVHIHGDTYGMEDFDRKVVTAVDRAKKRNSLRRTGVAYGR